jgi:hypothetical protein
VKLPNLRSDGGGAARKPPKILENIYRDLRDRRLLSIAIVLVLAIIAVPFLVKGDSDDGGTAGSTAVALAPLEGTEVLDPAVLAEEPVLRDFRKRLDTYRERNPFEQQMTGTPASLDDLSAEEDGGGTAVDGGGSSEDISVDDLTGVDTGEIDTGEIGSDDGGSAPPVPDPSDPDPVEPAEPPETTLVTTRIDVRMGTVGDTKKIKNVKPLDFLPERRGAVVEFVAGDFDLTRAIFIVSPDVLLSEGDGKCAPSPQQCDFLALDVGQEHSFQYDGERYRMKLLDVYLHEEPLKDDEEPSSKAAERGFDVAQAGRLVGG